LVVNSALFNHTGFSLGLCLSSSFPPLLWKIKWFVPLYSNHARDKKQGRKGRSKESSGLAEFLRWDPGLSR
jgi:hypothetical protein